MTAAELRYLIATDELYDGTIGVKLTEIASRTGVSKVSVYRAVERLEKGGYVKRDEKNKVVLTKYGKEQLNEYMIIINWLCNHLERHCNVSKETAYQDAIGASCAMSDESRHGFFDFFNKGGKQ